MNRFSFLSSLLCLSFTITQAAFSQAQSLLNKPFDLKSGLSKSGKLPARFLGHSPAYIFNSLSRKRIYKNRYETTPQFQIRQNALWNKPLFGQMYRSSPMAFVLSASTDYNADKVQITANFKLREDTEEDGTTALIKDYFPDPQGQNIYYGFQIVNRGAFPIRNFSDGTKGFVWTVPVAPDKAPQLEKNIAVAAFGRPVNPYFEGGSGKIPAELSNRSPSSVTIGDIMSIPRYGVVCLKVESIVLYDFRTGFIFSRIDAK